MAPQLEDLGFHHGLHYLAVNVTASPPAPEHTAGALRALLSQWLRGDAATDAKLAAIASAGRQLVLDRHTHRHRLAELLHVLHSATEHEGAVRAAPASDARSRQHSMGKSTESPAQLRGTVPGVGLIREARVVLLRPSGDVQFETLLPMIQAWVGNLRWGLPPVHFAIIRAPSFLNPGGADEAKAALRSVGLKCVP